MFLGRLGLVAKAAQAHREAGPKASKTWLGEARPHGHVHPVGAAARPPRLSSEFGMTIEVTVERSFYAAQRF